MSAEIVMAVASISCTALIAGGLVVTWRRNGREQRQRDEDMVVKQALRDKELELGYQSIVERLDNEMTGLRSLHSKLTDMQINCAQVTGRFEERIKATEKK